MPHLSDVEIMAQFSEFTSFSNLRASAIKGYRRHALPQGVQVSIRITRLFRIGSIPHAKIVRPCPRQAGPDSHLHAELVRRNGRGFGDMAASAAHRASALPLAQVRAGRPTGAACCFIQCLYAIPGNHTCGPNSHEFGHFGP